MTPGSTDRPAADNFWGSRFERAFFDVRVFNPFAPSNRSSSLSSCYRTGDMSNVSGKSNVEPFLPWCSPAQAEWVGRQWSLTNGYMATLMAAKRDEPYSRTLGWIRCRLSFSLLRSSIMCCRGARSSQGHAVRQLDAHI